MDFKFQQPKTSIPYWTLNFVSNKTNNPSFLNDLTLTNFNTENTIVWLSFLKSNTQAFNHKKNTNVLKTLNTISGNENFVRNSANYSAENLININFLRYERLYTKLKYSRSPAFDIVSGGAAAILAGFIGFLISEKFGFELVDSGDFYYLFMYIVFASFLVKPLLYTANSSGSFFKTLSYRNLLKFFIKLLLLSFLKIKQTLSIK